MERKPKTKDSKHLKRLNRNKRSKSKTLNTQTPTDSQSEVEELSDLLDSCLNAFSTTSVIAETAAIYDSARRVGCSQTANKSIPSEKATTKDGAASLHEPKHKKQDNHDKAMKDTSFQTANKSIPSEEVTTKDDESFLKESKNKNIFSNTKETMHPETPQVSRDYSSASRAKNMKNVSANSESCFDNEFINLKPWIETIKGISDGENLINADIIVKFFVDIFRESKTIPEPLLKEINQKIHDLMPVILNLFSSLVKTIPESLKNSLYENCQGTIPIVRDVLPKLIKSIPEAVLKDFVQNISNATPLIKVILPKLVNDIPAHVVRKALQNINEGISVIAEFLPLVQDFLPFVQNSVPMLAKNLIEPFVKEVVEKIEEILPLIQVAWPILLKEMLHIFRKIIVSKYPIWLVESQSTLSQQGYENYKKQYEIMLKLCDEAEKIFDVSNTFNKDQFDIVMKLMQMLQKYGNPPKELLIHFFPNVSFDSMSSFPFLSILQGQCPIM